jgi:hypothetical protein
VQCSAEAPERTDRLGIYHVVRVVRKLCKRAPLQSRQLCIRLFLKCQPHRPAAPGRRPCCRPVGRSAQEEDLQAHDHNRRYIRRGLLFEDTQRHSRSASSISKLFPRGGEEGRPDFLLSAAAPGALRGMSPSSHQQHYCRSCSSVSNFKLLVQLFVGYLSG